MCKGHIALQDIQAVVLMLCKMAIWLTNKVCALHLDSSTVKANSCTQGATASLFFPPDKHAAFLIWPASIMLFLFQHM